MYGTMGVVSLLLSLFLFYVYYFEINQEIFIPLVLAIFFLLGGIYLLLETWVQKVIINESNILQKKLWGDIVTISWNEIKDITYNGLSAQLSIVGSAGTLKIHKDSVGFPTLLDIIEMRYGKSAKDLGCPEYLIKKGN